MIDDDPMMMARTRRFKFRVPLALSGWQSDSVAARASATCRALAAKRPGALRRGRLQVTSTAGDGGGTVTVRLSAGQSQ